MNQKRLNKILLIVVVVCLAIAAVAWFMTRSTFRDATAEEVAFYSKYDVLWDAMPDAAQTQKEQVLSLCVAGEDTQLGDNQYKTYTSGELAARLYDCTTLDQIVENTTGVVYITYTTSDGLNVMLGYGDSGLQERSVYDPAQDRLYYETADSILIYDRFSSSVYF